MTTISINQPHYLPWLGHLDRVARSDAHVVLDDVQYERGSLVNRNVVRGRRPDPIWLTVPVSADFGTPIRRVRVAEDGRWRRRHRETLRQCYSGTDHAHEIVSRLMDELSEESATEIMVAYCRRTTSALCVATGVSTPFYFSHDLDVAGAKTDLVLDICRALGADTYISGPGGRAYLDVRRMRDGGVRVMWHDFEQPRYRQRGDGFVPRLSAADVVACVGGAEAARLAREGGVLTEARP